jgi:hypothetical protein
MPKYHIYNIDGTMSDVSRAVFFESINDYYIIDVNGTRLKVLRDEYLKAKKNHQPAEKEQMYWLCAEYDDYGKITEDSEPFLLPKTETFRELHLAYMRQHNAHERKRLRLLQAMQKIYGKEYSLSEKSLDEAIFN